MKCYRKTERGGGLLQLRFDAEAGTLTRNKPPHLPGGVGEGPRHMQFHPNSKWACFMNEGSHKLIVFRRNAETGALTPLKTYDCGKGPAWVMSVKF